MFMPVYICMQNTAFISLSSVTQPIYRYGVEWAHTLSHLTVIDYCSNFLGLGLVLGLTLTLTLTLILTLLDAIVYEPQHGDA